MSLEQDFKHGISEEVLTDLASLIQNVEVVNRSSFRTSFVEFYAGEPYLDDFTVGNFLGRGDKQRSLGHFKRQAVATAAQALKFLVWLDTDEGTNWTNTYFGVERDEGQKDD